MAKKKTTKKAGRPPAKAGSINKSQAIRDYLAKHPKAGPTEVAKALSAKGIKVAPAAVSNVAAAAKRKAGKKASKPKTTVTRVANDKVSLGSLVDAAQFIGKVGGADKAQELIKALEKLDMK